MKKNKFYMILICKIFILLSILIVCLTSSVLGGPADDPNKGMPPEFAITGTQVLKIHSNVTGQEYVLHVNLPQHYNDTSITYPVVYLLDSQWDFPLITAIYGDQYYDGFMPSTIIVGITWGGENPNYDTRRAFDLTPTGGMQSDRYGNAEKFLSFIKTEAIPFIDSKYRTNKNDRALLGHSLGGLFTLYTLFTEPNLFNKYIAASPALSWGQGSLNKFLEKFSKMNLSHPVKVYSFIGEYEGVQGFEKFTDAIKNCKMTGLDLETQVIKGAGHSGTKPEGYNRGLQQIFKRPCISLDQKLLEQYAGEYQIGPQMVIKIAPENGQLVASLPDNMKIILCAESDVDFYMTGAFFNARIVKDKDGKVAGLQVQQYNAGGFVKKVK